MNNPRSIFTGHRTSKELLRSLPHTDHISLSDPEYYQPIYEAAVESDSPLSDTQPITEPDNRTFDPSCFPDYNQSKSGDPGQSATSHLFDATRPGPTSQPSKRKRCSTESLSAHNSPESERPPLLKRRRRRLYSRSRHTVDHLDHRTLFERSHPPPPSPLFFSHHKHIQRPPLPARFSSSEAGARMLSKARGEDSSIKTVTLARGTLSPPVGSTTSHTRASSERSSIPPDGQERNDSLRLLGSIGVIELLEIDIRPTFVLDLVGTYVHGVSSAHTVFVNSSLRNDHGLYEHCIDGRSRESSPIEPVSKTSRAQFRAWLLSGTTSGDGDTTLPPHSYAGLVWSCTTIRKRLRVVSGIRYASVGATDAATPANTVPSDGEFNVTSAPPSSDIPMSVDIGVPQVAQSRESPKVPQDYFGNPAAIARSVEELPDVEIVANAESADQIHAIEPPRSGMSMPSLSITKFFRDEGPNLESHPSLTNECVLRASVAGDVDWFSRIPSPAKEPGGFFDWTRLPISDALPRHIQFARSVDWAGTSLGPIEFWSSDLRQMCNLIMASPHPAAMYWGDDLIAIYNEAYILLAGQKHPKLMGQSYKEAWAEIWEDVKEPFAEAKSTGQATMKDDDCLFIKRSDSLEETYFSWSIIPMVGGDGSVMGLYNPAFEKTRRKIAERRMLTLREVGERTANARDVKGFWQQVLTALHTNEYDAPFVMLYSVSDDSDSDSSSVHSSSLLGTKQCLLEGSLGVPEGHAIAPRLVDLKTSTEGFTPILREVTKIDKPVQLSIGTDVPAAMMEGLEPRGFKDACREVIVCPINPTTGESVLGFLIMGINPRRPYDDDYSLFVQLLSRQLATSLASVVLFEEEIRRGQRAAKLAALDRMELSEQLKDSETRFTRMAEFSPAGLFIADASGNINYCNETWYEVSRLPRDVNTNRWVEAVIEEDQQMVNEKWRKVVEEKEVVRCEFRFKTPWIADDGTRTHTWVLFSAYPETNHTNELKGVFGNVTDISQQKWAESFNRRRMEEAVELKRQQENFIDITSHEMRNPLSAILQCADEISNSLAEVRASGSTSMDETIIGGNIDAAQTIALCALHQKRIVDDVLTLSKLDSAMLHVTPVDVEPLAVVQRALKMFEGEVATADIALSFNVDKSYEQLGVEWVRMDPSRVLQVLINLTTNAIKFTTTEHRRTIIVGIAAFKEPPSKSGNSIVKFFPPRPNAKSQTQSKDWGDGEVVYLQFSVQDTGRGLNDEEKKMLFLRFSQASPRTHVTYGGSGLGLFISRELTELQGGEIGVASEAGKGSTFAFYVKCRRTSPPENPADQLPIVLPRQSWASSDGKFPSKKVDSSSKTKARDFAIGASKNDAPKVTVNRERSQIHVLIVEDNLVNQRVLQRQLQNNGFTVAVANHGGEALEALKGSTFYHNSPSSASTISVVLMDQEMPVMDGLQCTRKIREWEKEGLLVRHVPIIAVTANARAAQIQTLMDVGMDDVVSKPFRTPDLVPKIEELYNKHFDGS